MHAAVSDSEKYVKNISRRSYGIFIEYLYGMFCGRDSDKSRLVKDLKSYSFFLYST